MIHLSIKIIQILTLHQQKLFYMCRYFEFSKISSGKTKKIHKVIKYGQHSCTQSPIPSACW